MKNLLTALIVTLIIAGCSGSTGADFNSRQIGNWKLVSSTKAKYNPQNILSHQKSKIDSIKVSSPSDLNVTLETDNDTLTKWKLTIKDKQNSDFYSSFPGERTGLDFSRDEERFDIVQTRISLSLDLDGSSVVPRIYFWGDYKCSSKQREDLHIYYKVYDSSDIRDTTRLRILYDINAKGFSDALSEINGCS